MDLACYAENAGVPTIPSANETANPKRIGCLPEEILRLIFSYLDLRSVYRCSQVSSYWNEVTLNSHKPARVWIYWNPFGNVEIEGAVVRGLSAICGHHLRGLSLDERHNVCDDDLRVITLSCPNIEYLQISKCSGLSEAALKSVGKNSRRLEVLRVHKKPRMSPEAIQALGKGCPLLRTVDIGGEYANEEDHRFLRRWRPLKEGFCYERGPIDDAGVEALALSSTELTDVSLSGNFGVGDYGILQLVTHCRNLAHLHLAKTGITEMSLHAIREHCKKLKSLDIRWCWRITSGALEEFGRCYPGFAYRFDGRLREPR